MHDAEPTKDAAPCDPHRRRTVGTREGKGSVRRYDRHSRDPGLPGAVGSGEVSEVNVMDTYEQRAQEAREAIEDAPTTPYGVAIATIDLANVVIALAAEVDRLRGS